MENQYDINQMTEDRLIRSKRRKRKRTISTLFVMFGSVVILALMEEENNRKTHNRTCWKAQEDYS